MTIEWTTTYEVGNAEMDEQHRKLFDCINQFLVARDKRDLAPCAQNLLQHAREHFSHEEALMPRVNYPLTDLHIREHQDLLAEFDSIAECIANDTLVQAELESFLFDWLLNHVNTWDTQLASCAAAA